MLEQSMCHMDEAALTVFQDITSIIPLRKGQKVNASIP